MSCEFRREQKNFEYFLFLTVTGFNISQLGKGNQINLQCQSDSVHHVNANMHLKGWICKFCECLWVLASQHVHNYCVIMFLIYCKIAQIKWRRSYLSKWVLKILTLHSVMKNNLIWDVNHIHTLFFFSDNSVFVLKSLHLLSWISCKYNSAASFQLFVLCIKTAKC